MANIPQIFFHIFNFDKLMKIDADSVLMEHRSAAALMSLPHIKKLIPFGLKMKKVRLETKIVSSVSFFTARIYAIEVLDIILFFNYKLL